MAKRSSKKDFDREQMYQKIMPSLQTVSNIDDFYQSEPADFESGSRDDSGQAVNLMEIILRDLAPAPMEILRCCDCERCKNDVIAMALNHLPAMYVIMEPERQQQKIAELRTQYEVKAKSALIQAIQQVKGNPRHEE